MKTRLIIPLVVLAALQTYFLFVLTASCYTWYGETPELMAPLQFILPTDLSTEILLYGLAAFCVYAIILVVAHRKFLISCGLFLGLLLTPIIVGPVRWRSFWLQFNGQHMGTILPRL